jgi:uncharacterized protein YndB with AHSA1/START domain
MSGMALKHTTDSIVEHILIHADPESVFAALTEPNQLLSWWGDPAQYWCTSWRLDLRVGGKWRSEGTNPRGGSFVVEGEFLEIQPPKTLSFTWIASWTNAPTLTVRIVLEPHDKGTWVTWTMTGFEGHPQARRDHSGGLPSIVVWLRQYLEEGRTLSSA